MDRNPPRAAVPVFGFRFVAPLALGSTLLPLNSSVIATAMVPIAQSLGAGVTDVTWLITSCYLTMIVSQPVMGKLADMIGPKRVFLGALSLAAASGVWGLFAQTLGELVATRVLLGVGVSGAYPSAMRMFRERADAAGQPPPRKAMGVLALSSWTLAAAGPPLGGFLTTVFGWRSVFVMNLPLAFAAIALIYAWSPADGARTYSFRRLLKDLDVAGLALFAGFLLSVTPFLMHLDELNWLALAGAVGLGGLLVVWSRRRPRPFIDVPMMARNLGLTLTYLRFTTTVTVGYCMYLGFAQWAQAAGGYSPGMSGVLTLPMSIVAAGGTLAAARVRSIRALFALGCASALLGSLIFLRLDHASSPWVLAGTLALFGLPFGLASTATQVAVYIQSPPEQIGVSAGLQRTFGYFGSILAGSLLALFFGVSPSDGGMHGLMVVLAATSGLLLVAVLLDRTLPRPG